MELRWSDRKLKPLPPDLFRHQDSAIAQAAFAATMERRTETLATRDIASMNDPNGGQRHHEHRTRYDDPTSRNGDCGRNPESEPTSLHATPLQSY
jgi:hypothetical protein